MVHRICSDYRNGNCNSGGSFSRKGGCKNPSSRGYPQLLIFFVALLFSTDVIAAPSLSQNHVKLKHPIVLVHGATIHGANLNIGPFDFGEYFAGIKEFLEASGTEVRIATLTTDGSIGERAAVLKNFLETDMKGQMVNIIAHSLGGLDARYAVSVLKSFQIASITTIGTPHRGTPLADWAVYQMDHNGVWYWIFKAIGYDMTSRRFLRELTTNGMKVFNDRVPDSSEVRYFSVKARATLGAGTLSAWLWLPGHWLEGERHYLSANGHDGLVPFDSQGWGKVVGALEMDHLGEMNHHEGRMTDMKREALTMYVNIYENLEQEGL